MRIRLAVPEAAIAPDVLNAALEAVTRTNERLLEAGRIPTAAEGIERGIKWRPEPPGDEHFDVATTVMHRGHGDCDDLAPWHAASLRHTGEDPDAEAIVLKSGPKRWHAVVQRSDGSIDDPSAEAGMYEYRSPVQPRLKGPTNRPHITSQVVGSLWCCRCDVPWKGSNYALSAHAAHPHPAVALSRAIQGACTVGDSSGVVEREHLLRLAAVQALAQGEHPEVVRAELIRHGYNPAAASHVVGSLFGSIFKGISKIASPLASVATSMIPGGGLIKAGLDAAGHLIPHGGGHGGGPQGVPGAHPGMAHPGSGFRRPTVGPARTPGGGHSLTVPSHQATTSPAGPVAPVVVVRF